MAIFDHTAYPTLIEGMQVVWCDHHVLTYTLNKECVWQVR